MIINYSRQFRKQYKKLPKKIKEKFNDRLVLFLKNMNDPQLSIHKLSGKLEDLWSFSVTGDIRIIFDKSFSGVIILESIGSHSELYE